MLEKIHGRAQESGLATVVYVSMAFGNPYGDPWGKDLLAEAIERVRGLGVNSISLADTAGVATAGLIHEVVGATRGNEIGVHLHSARATAAEKVLAAYDAGCRRFDSALGGLGGCPFAQDELVGNIPTEEVRAALAARGEDSLGWGDLGEVTALNEQIRREFSV